MSNDMTHFADDATLKRLRELEAENKRLREVYEFINKFSGVEELRQENKWLRAALQVKLEDLIDLADDGFIVEPEDDSWRKELAKLKGEE